jgi:hypothetical protein
MEVNEMTDEEILLYRARRWAADRYRAGGHHAFANRVEHGLEDKCSQVRLGLFFFEPPHLGAPTFIGGSSEFASIRTTSPN